MKQKISSAILSGLALFLLSEHAPAQRPDSAAENSLIPISFVYDLDSNRYSILKIGNLYWFTENLRTSKYNDTTAIATGLSNRDWAGTIAGAYAIYEDKPVHENSFGKLYNGYAAYSGKLCPKGWRVATDKDWNQLELFAGLPEAELDHTGERGKIAAILKSPGYWHKSDYQQLNSLGFSLLPGGVRLDNGDYSTLGQYGNFWTSTVYDDRYGQLYLWNHHTYYNTDAMGRIYTKANNGYSCRCVADSLPAEQK